ncbi:tudor and KH domain containing protein papi isoform X1 [Nomia melanderi]|uniref:tudor and KH domain containing protein papi isoform X1 n=2 Tax=Nomia melanderi TaxID=2448451 RepID=UPI003FCDA20B
MKWSSPRFTLPILIGISLTSVSIAVIYLLLKKDEEDSTSRRNHIEIAKRISIECKVPRQFVPAVIGRGGSVIKDVQNKSGTQIFFKEDNLECPERICIIRGTYECTQLAQEMIKSIIENQPVIETYEIYIPQRACGRIIGRGGESIHQIQITSGAKVMVESGYTYVQNAERRVIIKGTAEQIAAALTQIEEKVREECADEESAKRKLYGKLEASPAIKLPIYTTERPQSTESLSLQGTEGTMEVYVSAMESPSKFWVQIVGRGTIALNKLVSEMTAYYNDEQNHELHKLKDIIPGQICAAKFSSDEQWYRAQIISAAVEDGKCEVYFMDYGDHDVVPFDNILEIRTDFLSLRMQAMECSLSNVKPREDEWSAEACDRFAELTWLAQWRVLLAKIEGSKDRTRSYGASHREGSPIPCVDLFDKNEDKEINVAEELIKEGFAEPEDPLISTIASAAFSPRSISPAEKRTLRTKTPTPTPSKLKTHPNFVDLVDVTTSLTNEIDLTTPKKPAARIEEIDLVTPVKDETARFIDNEKKVPREDGSGDYLRNGSSGHRYDRPHASGFKFNRTQRIAPAGYESDLSNDSDELELGRTIFRSFLSTGKSRNRPDDRKKERTKPSQTWRRRKERYRKLLRWNGE